MKVNNNIMEVETIVSEITNEFTLKQNELVEKLIKERLTILNVKYDNFLDFVKENLTRSCTPTETTIFYKDSPLLTYWFETGMPNFKTEPITITANFYYK